MLRWEIFQKRMFRVLLVVNSFKNEKNVSGCHIWMVILVRGISNENVPPQTLFVAECSILWEYFIDRSGEQ